MAKSKMDKKLVINGSLIDILKASVSGNPKPKPKKKTAKKKK